MSKMSSRKQPIRDFMQRHYTDERLAMLLAHAKDGKLAFASCCCFVGVSDAQHVLRVYDDRDWRGHTLGIEGHKWDGSMAYAALVHIDLEQRGETDAMRRRILIPMIRAEMWRRAKLHKVTMAAELNQPASPIQSTQESVLEQDVAK